MWMTSVPDKEAFPMFGEFSEDDVTAVIRTYVPYVIVAQRSSDTRPDYSAKK